MTVSAYCCVAARYRADLDAVFPGTGRRVVDVAVDVAVEVNLYLLF